MMLMFSMPMITTLGTRCGRSMLRCILEHRWSVDAAWSGTINFLTFQETWEEALKAKEFSERQNGLLKCRRLYMIYDARCLNSSKKPDSWFGSIISRPIDAEAA